MRMFDALPRFTAFATLVAWGFTLPILAGFGRRLTEFSTLVFVLGIGIASLLILYAQNPDMRGSNLMLWVSAGIWTAASYLNSQVVGFLYLLVGLLALGSAAVREQKVGRLSLAGPAGFFLALTLMIAVSLALAG